MQANKVALLLRHAFDCKRVSDLCDDVVLSSNTRWLIWLCSFLVTRSLFAYQMLRSSDETVFVVGFLKLLDFRVVEWCDCVLQN